ncbi:uncharacterized protein LOC120187640 [Hibiscus syriacus]|uniref:uncharacterized protein LOC120187640 n=1 Tax=Hibiscus syriacus TaxID=106335 RepID=UPI00192223E5|nr:uncharacterized protein LOC120187640 [Hibiscus syriacus]
MKEDTSVYGLHAKELSLVPDLVLPPKFKIPDFEKFDYNMCPYAHITMFYRKMTGYIGDDQLLIRYFQESLTSLAIRWPNRMILQGMGKKSNESFRQYAQRWRDVVVQVHTPLEEEETNMLFINTLSAPFFTHLIVNPYQSFTDMVMAGEMIEMVVKNGKLEEGESNKESQMKKKENEVNNGTGSSTQNTNRQGVREYRERPQFDLILITYKELFQILYDQHVVSPYYMSPLQPPYPKWYDAHAQCEYHAGTPRHSVENCTSFKKVVQHLRRKNIINFCDSEQPNIAQNPLPKHVGAGINVITEEKGRKIIKNVREVESSMYWVRCQMIKVRLLRPNPSSELFNSEEICHYHNCEGHNIQRCHDFLELVKEMIDNKKIEFFKEVVEEEKTEICASEGSSKGVYNASCPLIITPKSRVTERVASKVVITPPSLFPYRDNKQVPWRYVC